MPRDSSLRTLLAEVLKKEGQTFESIRNLPQNDDGSIESKLNKNGINIIVIDSEINKNIIIRENYDKFIDVPGLSRNGKEIAKALDKYYLEGEDGSVKEKVKEIGNGLKDRVIKDVEQLNGGFLANMMKSGMIEREGGLLYGEIRRGYESGLGLYGKMLGGYKEYSDRGDGLGKYRNMKQGVEIGYEMALKKEESGSILNKIKMGIYGSVKKDEVESGSDNKGTIKRGEIGLYGKSEIEEWKIGCRLGLGTNYYKTERKIGVSYDRKNAVGEYRGITMAGEVEVGRKLGNYKGIEISGYMGIEGGIVDNGRIEEESESKLSLIAEAGSYRRVIGKTGVELRMEERRMGFRGNVEYKRIASGEKAKLDVKIKDSKEGFEAYGKEEGKDIVGLGIGMDYRLSKTKDIRLSVGINGEAGRKYHVVGGCLAIGYYFGAKDSSKATNREKVQQMLEISTRQKKSIRNIKEDISASSNLGGSASSKTSNQKKVRTAVVRQQAKRKQLPNSTEQLPVVEFLFNSTKITPKTQKNLYSIANKLKKYPNRQLVITGHTDSIGEMKYNKNLSLRRAISVQKLLRNKFGIKNKIKVLGIDCRKPIASNKTSQDRQRNRRVSVYIDNS